MTRVNEFDADLKYSRGQCEATDLETLKLYIPGCVSVVKTDPIMDRTGVDYIATLRRGAVVLVDAKTRRAGARKYWRFREPELALEAYSVKPGTSLACPEGKVGWTLCEKKNVDLIYYTFDPQDSSEFFLLGFQHLRMAFVEFFKEWKDAYGFKDEWNRGYRSEACFVPARAVIEAIALVSRKEIKVTSPTLDPPMPEFAKKQQTEMFANQWPT